MSLEQNSLISSLYKLCFFFCLQPVFGYHHFLVEIPAPMVPIQTIEPVAWEGAKSCPSQVLSRGLSIL